MYKIWIIVLIGVSLIGFLYKTILPDGKMSKVTAFVFSILMLTCLIEPVCHLCEFNAQPDYSFFSNDILSEKLETYQIDFTEKYYFAIISERLKQKNIVIKKIIFEFNITNGEVYPKKITIKKNDLVYSGNKNNSNIPTLTRDIIAEFTGLEKEYVIICE